LKRLKKSYQDFKSRQYLDYDRYCELTERLLNQPVDYLCKLFFNTLDFNQDGKLCEWDLFTAFEHMMTTQQGVEEDLIRLLNDDLLMLSQEMRR
jgi:hypothetical protein